MNKPYERQAIWKHTILHPQFCRAFLRTFRYDKIYVHLLHLHLQLIYVPASLLFRQIFMRATVVRTRLLTNMQIKNEKKVGKYVNLIKFYNNLPLSEINWY